MTLKNTLVEQGISVSFGSAAATPIHINNHSLKDLVRVSVHYYNTQEEITKLCQAVAVILAPNKAETFLKGK